MISHLFLTWVYQFKKLFDSPFYLSSSFYFMCSFKSHNDRGTVLKAKEVFYSL